MGMAMLSSCLANAAPDAGQALRDVESRRLNLPAPVELDAERPSPEDGVSRAAEEGGPTVLIKRFQLSGNRQFDDRRLLALLHDLPGQELNLSQLHAAAARIGDFYQEKGYVLARAFLPAQEIQDGTVRIEVLEGRYGRIELHNTSRTLDRVLLRPLSALERDTAVQGSELERALLLLSDIPGLQAKGTLLPGQAQGTTDLRVEARPGPLVGGRLEADNHGGRYMGEYRLGTTLDFNSPLRLGDQARLSLLGSDRHQRYYRAAYQLPLGSRGTRIGLAHAETTYRLVRDFSRLDAHGRAITDSLFVSQPLLRSRSLSLSTQLQYENKRLRDDQERTGRHSRKEIRLWTASISGNAQDRLFGGGQSGFSLAYAHGQLAIDSAEERLLDRYTIGTAGSFDKIMLNAVRLQHLGDRLQLFAQLNAQWSGGNLDSAEQFDMGGPYGVRAFPLGSYKGYGDEGWQASAELRYSLAPGWQLSSFVDQGAVKFLKHPNTTAGNRNRMAAVGSGATWYGTDHQVSLTAAWPLSQENNIAPERTPRLWLQATRYF
ncbi:ShlB/FhaC/HecB family hemolysin secretion/activation protein [Pseudomonas aeruginosa]|nr:ShlB/FhaC/HecB family hemolysin secretion/activation protein [Pseudomonas aeruginosa]